MPMCMPVKLALAGVAGRPTMIHFLPMVILVAFEGAQGLDVFGPAEVFAAGGYQVVLAAMGARSVRATSGIKLATRDLASIRPRAEDTVLVVGGEEEAIRAAVDSAPLLRWLTRAA